jgi:CubicO group peptidase (beta-lactamase class C family)
VIDGIVRLVNDGDPRRIAAGVPDLWSPTRLVEPRRSAVIRMLGLSRWRTGGLTLQRVCGTPLPYTGYALVRTVAQETVDSLHVVADSTGRVLQLALVPGRQPVLGAGDTSSDAARARALRRLMRRLADADIFAGEVLLARDGRILYHEAVGTSNRTTGQPAKIGDAYNIASVGKLFTGTAVLQLVEQGRVALEDTLGRFLSPAERPRDAGAVQIRHLLSHTAGVLRDQDTLQFAPGTRFSYSNYGYHLLARVIEKVTALPFADHYETAVFAPSGMTSTRRLVLRDPDPSLPPAYEIVWDSLAGVQYRPNPLAQTIPATGAGGFFSTALDLFRFAEALRQGRLLRPETVRAMRVPRTELGAVDYGYGIDRERGQGIWGHTGGIPGAEADVELFGDSGYVLVVLSNTAQNASVRSLAHALVGPRPLREQ